MKKHIVNKFDKHLITQLPRVLFEGRIITIFSEGEAERAVDFLLTHSILGLDTETRPSFTKGKRYKVSLLQVSTHDTCFLFRLNMLKDSPSIKRLLEDTSIPKIGLSLHDDVLSLRKRWADLTPGNFIDLQDIMKEIGIQDLGLAKIYANVFGQKISKREQLSNWEAEMLTEKQKRYAATDAWACIMLYEEYLRLKKTGDYILEIIPEPEPPQPKVENDDTKADSEAKTDNSKEKARNSKGKADTKKAKAKAKPKAPKRTKNKEKAKVK